MFAQRATHRIYHYDPVENQFPAALRHDQEEDPCLRLQARFLQQDKIRIMMSYNVCDVRCPMLNASVVAAAV